jgi:hypothetical protein
LLIERRQRAGLRIDRKGSYSSRPLARETVDLDGGIEEFPVRMNGPERRIDRLAGKSLGRQFAGRQAKLEEINPLALGTGVCADVDAEFFRFGVVVRCGGRESGGAGDKSQDKQ